MNRQGGGRQYSYSNRGGGRGGGRGGRRHDRNNNNNYKGQSFANNTNRDYKHFHLIESSGNPSSTSFTVAVQGCCHGELDSIYDALEEYRVEKLDKCKKIDVLLCCGDVQTLRNTDDFHSLNVPPKYKRIGDFHAYYSGQKVAPILTIMIGGNHEASNYLQELHYGGWVAPNIFYLGAAGVINICKKTSSSNVSSLRIAGISGIYSPQHYKLGRFEVPPYGQSELRSVYHTREVEVKRLESLALLNERSIDVFISHDWPRGIYHHGNVTELLKKKPFFGKEVHENSLGSPANEQLLYLLRPRYWFSAHLHVKFAAQVRHEDSDGLDNNNEGLKADKARKTIEQKGTDEYATTEFRAMESNDGICPDTTANVQSLTDQMTRFLSLDKCLPKRRHIQIMHVEPTTERSADDNPSTEIKNIPWLEYDLHWLSVLSQTHEWTQRTRSPVDLANENISITKDHVQNLEKSLSVKNKGGSDNFPMTIPLNFSMTVRPFDPSFTRQSFNAPSQFGNPQTDEFLSMMGLSHRITIPYDRGSSQDGSRYTQTLPTSLRPSQVIINNRRAVGDNNEIELEEDDEDVDKFNAVSQNLVDTCEIAIDSGEDDGEDCVSSVPKKPKV